MPATLGPLAEQSWLISRYLEIPAHTSLITALQGTCKRGDVCPYAHGVFESWLHPAKYRTQLCKDAGVCGRSVCFFAHRLEELRTPDAGSEPAPALLVRPPSVSSASRENCNIGAIEEARSSLSPPLALMGLGDATSRDSSMHGSSGDTSFLSHPFLSAGNGPAASAAAAATSAWMASQQQQQQALNAHSASSGSLAALMDALKLHDTLPPPHVPMSSAYRVQQQAYGNGLLPLQAAGFFTPPASPASAMSTPNYSPMPLYSPGYGGGYLAGSLPDLTNPLLAGALQAGVLQQVLAQLSPQQLALLSQQQHQRQPSPQMMVPPPPPPSMGIPSSRQGGYVTPPRKAVPMVAGGQLGWLPPAAVALIGMPGLGPANDVMHLQDQLGGAYFMGSGLGVPSQLPASSWSTEALRGNAFSRQA